MSKPPRIASLLASATEILYRLGVGKQIVAVSHECDFPPAARAKPRATLSHVDSGRCSLEIDRQVKQHLAADRPLYELDKSLLCALQPDLIVTQAQCDVCAIKYEDVLTLVRNNNTLEHANVMALNPTTLEEVFTDIGRIGQAISRTAAATQLVAQLRRRTAAIRSATVDLPAEARPRVLCIEWLDPLMIAGNWTPQLVELAGGRSGLSVPGRHSPYVTWDQIVTYDPEVLVVIPCGFDLHRAQRESVSLFARDGWSNLAAVRDGRVFAMDANAYFNRSGPRLVDSLELLAHVIHPQRIGPPTTVAEPALAWSAISP